VACQSVTAPSSSREGVDYLCLLLWWASVISRLSQCGWRWGISALSPSSLMSLWLDDWLRAHRLAKYNCYTCTHFKRTYSSWFTNVNFYFAIFNYAYTDI